MVAFNKGRRRKTLPDLVGKKVELVEIFQRNKNDPERWFATLKVNGWPHDIGFWAKDELDVMKQVYELQRGERPENAFDVSK